MENVAKEGRALRPASLCVHVATGAAGAGLVPAIVRSSTFRLDDTVYAERAAGRAERTLCYTRETNPTLEAVEARIAALEGAERSLVFASGQAALHALLLSTLERGERVLLFRQIYGGTVDLCRLLCPRLGVELEFIDANDLDALAPLCDGALRLVLCESLSNPLNCVADLPRLAALLRARAPRAILGVDATLASPLGQRPLELGAQLVYHSATKYLGGHSDLIGGVLSGSAERVKAAWLWRTKAGGCMDPEPAYLLDRGIRTLALRLAAQSATALALARFLERHPRVARVHYCGLDSHPHHALARELLHHTGGLFSFVLRAATGDADAEALRVIRRLELFTEAASLGGVESLASRPRDLSQVGLSAEERLRAGLEPGLIRLSVGIEDPLDLEEDLARALA
ncbi:MAG: aminotransferase class I/II-fold pyridoxal phosphate-dependent enzyme [Planctomycetes bacterium]|nr:aminotransferase class I/II-fold pyridoxal phosphate-dependent enzyme [Planctomycetota bacterium]